MLASLGGKMAHRVASTALRSGASSASQVGQKSEFSPAIAPLSIWQLHEKRVTTRTAATARFMTQSTPRCQRGHRAGRLTSNKWGRDMCQHQNELGLKGRTTAFAKRGTWFLQELETLREQKSQEASSGPSPLDFDSPLEVVLYPDPRLRAPNKLVTDFGSGQLQRLADEMLDVMYRTDGVGLSAPQVGVNVRLMVYNPQGERGKGQEYVLVNPRIVKMLKATEVELEGCLSFPDINADVERSVGVKVDAQDVRGKRFSLNLKGWQARIFQHEYDHLQGTLFFERMKPEVLEGILDQLLELEDNYEKTTLLKRPESVSRLVLQNV